MLENGIERWKNKKQKRGGRTKISERMGEH